MPVIRRLFRRALRRDEGFTLVELLVSMGLLTIGIVGVGAALLAQSGGLSSGSSYGLAAISRANYISTATMLAQERIEQIKNAQYWVTVATPVRTRNQITGGPTGNFPDEALGCVDVVPPVPPCTGSSFPNFRRTVLIETNATVQALPAGVQRITVSVFFTPPQGGGFGLEEAVQLVTLIAERPI